MRKAADQGHANAQLSLLRLGLSYALGKGVDRDLVQAASWFRNAADQGHARGQYSLGLCYADGVGVTKNAVKALVYFPKATQQNDQRALTRLHLPMQGWYPQLHGMFFPPARQVGDAAGCAPVFGEAARGTLA